jgi:hypothetical protein
MKFTIELEDFWLDEDSNGLDAELKRFVTSEVVKTIYAKIESKIDDQIVRQVKETVESTMYKKASLYMEKCFEGETIMADVYENGRSSKKAITLNEYVVNKFTKDSGWASPNEKIEKLAKQFSEKFGQEIKDRYDMMFATQIVLKLDKEGLLKDGVVKTLMQNNG